MANLLRVRNLSKAFGPTVALSDVSVDLDAGEVRGLVGGNGSGKSTLVKVLAGVHRGEPGGEILAGDERIATESWSPDAADRAGLRFVHQDLGVFPALTVAENLAIGRGFPTGRGGRIRRKATRRWARALLDDFEIAVDADQPLGTLGRAEQTMVAIVRALPDADDVRPRVLVLDEPTTALPGDEVEMLLAALSRCATRGHAVLFVSHRLDEVLSICIAVTVLRDGRLALTAPAEELDIHALTRAIVGGEVNAPRKRRFAAPTGLPRLELREVTGGPLADVSFAVARGEVVGVAGLLGAGRSELLRLIFGALPIESGTVLVDGAPVRFQEPAAAIRAGIAYLPEDRTADGMFVDQTLRENYSAPSLGRYWRRLRLRRTTERADARAAMTRYSIKAESEESPVATLSGGNQQKLMAARWLGREPRILLLDEPTQGVDVGARVQIHSLVQSAAAQGAAVLIVSSAFEELTQ